MFSFASVLRNLSFILRYYFYWLILFQLLRVLFLCFNLPMASDVSFKDLALTLAYGFRLDLSMSAYFMVIPILLWGISGFITTTKWLDRILKTYNTILIIAIIALSVIDAELYRFWGQKLNAYASSFAKFPKEMMSFSGSASYGKMIVSIVLLSASAVALYYKLPLRFDETKSRLKRIHYVWMFVLMQGFNFLFIRGGWGMATINQSSAYFSQVPFVNHLAVNATWNFVASLIDNPENENRNPYQYESPEKAQQLVNNLFGNKGFDQPVLIVNTNKPNILLVILEGWTADVVDVVGGEKDITPNFNRLSKNGLLYTRFYANGNRTDKGLAAIISGQPALAKSSIINRIQKFSNLPALSNVLKKNGYTTQFIYGGESEFANMKAYWINSGYERITDIHDFGKSTMPESWGVHDDVLFDKVYEEINNSKTPFFITTLTLSSHEPYKVPHQSRFSGPDEASGYRNAVHFSDEALSTFLDKASQASWYNNTLIIVLPDHGHHMPLNRNAYQPEKFHIPFFITGGALKQEWRGRVINNVAQQTDIAPSLLNQLKMDHTAFNWGRNLFDTTCAGFATYTFNDGIGLVTPGGDLVFDHESKKVISEHGEVNDSLVKTAKAYEQLFYDEYLKR